MKFLGLEIKLAGRSSTEERSAELSDLTNPTEWLVRSLMGAASSATGISVTPLKALGVSTVFGCVRVLADTMSSLPLEVFIETSTECRPAREHRLFQRLRLRPNMEMSSMDARSAMQVNLTLHSNAYAEVLRDMDGDAIGFYPVESRRVELLRRATDKRLIYRVSDTGAEFYQKDFIHLRSYSFNGLTGTSATSTARECIALAIALQDNAAKFFGNGSRPSAVLEHPASLSEEAQKRLKKQIEENSGGRASYSLLLLEEGLRFAKERSENKDSQFVESRDRQDLEICRIFGVPPHKLGISVGARTGGSVEEDNLAFISDRIRPLATQWEQELDFKLLTEEERDQGFCIRHDLDDLQRGNMQARFAAYGIGRQWGILTQNDCRRRERLPTVADGDVTLQPLNMIDSAKASEYLLASKEPKTTSQP